MHVWREHPFDIRRIRELQQQNEPGVHWKKEEGGGGKGEHIDPLCLVPCTGTMRAMRRLQKMCMKAKKKKNRKGLGGAPCDRELLLRVG